MTLSSPTICFSLLHRSPLVFYVNLHAALSGSDQCALVICMLNKQYFYRALKFWRQARVTFSLPPPSPLPPPSLPLHLLFPPPLSSIFLLYSIFPFFIFFCSFIFYFFSSLLSLAPPSFPAESLEDLFRAITLKGDQMARSPELDHSWAPTPPWVQLAKAHPCIHTNTQNTLTHSWNIHT